MGIKGYPSNPTGFTRLRIKDGVLSAESSKLPDEHRCSWVGRDLCNNAHRGSPIGLIPTLSQNKSWYLGKFYLHLTSVHHGLVRMTFIQLEAKLYQHQPTSSQRTSRFRAPFNWKNGLLPHHLQATAKKGLVDIFPFGVTAVAALDKLKPSTFADGSMLGEVESEKWLPMVRCLKGWWKMRIIR